MYSLILLGCSAFLISLALTPICRELFRRLGVVDQPGEARKIHTVPIPRCGGVPLATAYLGAFLVLMLSPLQGGGVALHALPFVVQLLPAVGLVFATGLADDVVGLRPVLKLAGQVGGAALALWAGVEIHSIAGFEFAPWIGVPITIVWLVGCSNAVNLIDGVDGLAAGVGFFASLTVLVSTLLTGNYTLALVTAPLTAALLGFLRYNFNPATVFLGDSGSLTLGFLLGCFGVLWSEKATTILAMTAPLMAVAIPLLDTGLSILRRALRLRPIFGADRGHIHHRLLARGLTPRRVALILYGVCCVSAVLSLLVQAAHEQYRLALVVVFCIGTWVGIQQLGYREFGIARKIVQAGTFRRLVDAHMGIGSFRDAVAKAQDLDGCWDALRSSYAQFGYWSVEMNVLGRLYYDELADPMPTQVLRIHLELEPGDYVLMVRGLNSAAQAIVAAPYADAIATALKSRVSELRHADEPGLRFRRAAASG